MNRQATSFDSERDLNSFEKNQICFKNKHSKQQSALRSSKFFSLDSFCDCTQNDHMSIENISDGEILFFALFG
ncbi:hypothetical protein BAT_2480 [Bacillus pumilus ATCC 7061]|nr:hypothetical protein BAT_2480 [Bacillus pumilus ATCC 7061]